MLIAVDQALVSSFIAGSFGLPIAHENLEYTPTTGTAYAEITVFDSSKVPELINNWDRQVGIFQVVLRYPTNGGAIAAKTKAAEILDHFKLYSIHEYSDQKVRITEHKRGPGYPEAGWYKIVLRMSFLAFTPR